MNSCSPITCTGVLADISGKSQILVAESPILVVEGLLHYFHLFSCDLCTCSLYIHVGALCMRFDMSYMRADVLSVCGFGCCEFWNFRGFYVLAKSAQGPDSDLQIRASGKAPSVQH